jgi:dolichol-phosphate mannosyltransferase
VQAISVVVPTYNESKNVPVLYERLTAALDAAGRPFQLLVVDDDSSDGTGAVVDALGPNARAIVRKGERGLATAVIRGLQDADNDLCVVMDADLSHPPETVPELARKVEEGAPFAIGSRYIDGGRTQDWSALRAVNSWGATILARPLTKVRDPMSGFFAVRRSTIPFGELNPVGYKIALEILVKSGVKEPLEIPIVFTDRLHGESKMTMKEQYRYILHLARLYAYTFGPTKSSSKTTATDQNLRV